MSEFPAQRKAFARTLRNAFSIPDGDAAGSLDDGLQGDSVRLTTTLLEGGDRAILSIQAGGETLAKCFVTRKDLLDLKSDFDVFAKAKKGKNPLTKRQHRQLRAAIKGGDRSWLDTHARSR